jgi:4-amino-4-deoxy-L-arabinose transferase-like glycosyltransferase
MKLDPALQSLNLHKQAPLTGADRAGTTFLLLLAAYFLVQIIIRVSVAGTLDLDEAEQAFESQVLRMGYGTQPPLYNWLQGLMFRVFGLNLFALAALKNLVLFVLYACMFLMARPLVGVGAATTATASLLLIPQIGWEAQRDLTHSVLLTSLACATLWSYFRLLRQPTATRYALFGLLIGLGLQSKYNFALFVSGLTIASLLNEHHRRIVWNGKVLIAIAIAILCLLPHGIWLLNNIGAAGGGSLEKMAAGARDASYLHNVLSGMGSILLAAFAFITPLWLVYTVVCGRRFKQASLDLRNPDARFFITLYAVFFALLTVLVLSGEVSKIKDRWMQPLLFSLPLAFFMIFPALAQADVFRRILRVVAVAAVVIMLGLVLRVYLGASSGKLVRAHHPYPQLAAEIGREFPDIRTVVTSSKLVAGNLHFYRQTLRTLLLNQLIGQPLPLDEKILLIVPEGTQPGWLQGFRAAYPQSTVEQEGRIRLPYRFGSKKLMSFEYAHIVVRSQ